MSRRWWATALLLGGLLLLWPAWLRIQVVRWGYKIKTKEARLDELNKEEQKLDWQLQKTLALPRLEELAKKRYGLVRPNPSQIILLPEPQ